MVMILLAPSAVIVAFVGFWTWHLYSKKDLNAALMHIYPMTIIQHSTALLKSLPVFGQKTPDKQHLAKRKSADLAKFGLHDSKNSANYSNGSLESSTVCCNCKGSLKKPNAPKLPQQKEQHEVIDTGTDPIPIRKNTASQANLVSLMPLWQAEDAPKLRSLQDLCNLMQADMTDGVRQMTNAEILFLIEKGKLRPHQLEKDLGDDHRAVFIRRLWFGGLCGREGAVKNIPHENYDYSYVSNACCENVLGYVPIPVGFVGPLIVNNRRHFVPMATTEGCLIASTNRGCRAIQSGEGVKSYVYHNGMTRAPVVRFLNAGEALDCMNWIHDTENFKIIKKQFQTTSRFAELESVTCVPAGRHLYMRFLANTKDAMGMNMISKGSEAVLRLLKNEHFPHMDIISISGNYCTDKKPAAINWIQGRGKSVVADAIIPAATVQNMLKTNVEALVELNISKDLVGSAMAGSIGGFNAHSANIVTAIYLACGQDAAQNINSSNCITLVERNPNGDLYMSCTMPSLELGTIGGGTLLPAQNACLEMIGCAGGNRAEPGSNAIHLAEIICATVLAGELSLLSALSSGDLVRSHIKYNRSNINLCVLST